MPDGRDDDHRDGAGGAYDTGPEEGGALSCCPAPVAERRLPEQGHLAGHFGSICREASCQARAAGAGLGRLTLRVVAIELSSSALLGPWTVYRAQRAAVTEMPSSQRLAPGNWCAFIGQ